MFMEEDLNDSLVAEIERLKAQNALNLDLANQQNERNKERAEAAETKSKALEAQLADALTFLRSAAYSHKEIISTGRLTAQNIDNYRRAGAMYVEPGGGLGWVVRDSDQFKVCSEQLHAQVASLEKEREEARKPCPCGTDDFSVAGAIKRGRCYNCRQRQDDVLRAEGNKERADTAEAKVTELEGQVEYEQERNHNNVTMLGEQVVSLEKKRAAAESLLREIVTWLGQQQGRKGVWLAAIDNFREKAKALLQEGQ